MEINEYLPHGFVAGLKTVSGYGSAGGAVSIPLSDGHPSPNRCGRSQLPLVSRADPGFHTSCLAKRGRGGYPFLGAANDSPGRGTEAWPLVSRKDAPLVLAAPSLALPVGSGLS